MQRFEHFMKALELLKIAVEKYFKIGLNELEEQGLIQRFEFTHELAWKVLKDYFEYQGVTGITGSRDAIREAFKNGLVNDGESWMGMIQSRNLSTHTYNEELAMELTKKICDTYYRCFMELRDQLQQKTIN